MAHPYFDEAIEAAVDCAKECEMCAVDCLQSPEVSQLRDCILLCLDSANLCHSAISLLSRDSRFSREFLAFSWQVFDECGKVCKQHKDIPACSTCQQSCEHLSSLCSRLQKGFGPGVQS